LYGGNSSRCLVRSAHLPEIRLYDLRHTAATISLGAGVSPKVISEQLGHASVAFTLDVYSHVLPHMQEAAAEKVQALLIDGSAHAMHSDPSSPYMRLNDSRPDPDPPLDELMPLHPCGVPSDLHKRRVSYWGNPGQGERASRMIPD
jgi:hypothetical protein